MWGRLSARIRKLLVGAFVGLGIGLAAALLAFLRPSALERGEWWTYDQRARAAAHREDASQQIVVIDISDDDIKNVETNFEGVSWPWPRSVYGYLTHVLTEAHAKAVVFDWIFQDRGGYSVNDAEEFARELQANGRSVFGLALSREPRPAATAAGMIADLPAYPERKAAVAAALRLLAWNFRVFVRENPDKTFTVSYGGLPRESFMARWTTVSTPGDGALADLFAPPAPPPAPAPAPVPDGAEPAPEPEPVPPPAPVIREMAAADLPFEYTAEQIVAERDGWIIASRHNTPSRSSMNPPLSVLAGAPAHLGVITQTPEADGIMRRHAYLTEYNGRYYPSLALAAYQIAHPTVKPKFEGSELVLGTRRVPLDPSGQAGIRYHGARLYKHVPAYEVLRSFALMSEGKPPVVPLEVFTGKYVFISATAQALRDIRVSPVSQVHLGAEINAQALDNLESGMFVTRTKPWVDAIIAFNLSLLLAMAVVLIWSAVKHPALALLAVIAVTGVVLGGYWYLASYLYDSSGTWIGVTVPAFGGIGATFVAILVTSAIERRSKRFVQEALGRYTSPELVRELIAHPEHLSLEWGDRREMSVYFSDIAGFTTISEGLEPERLVALLNEYLTEMTDIVLASGGVVDKYIGDAVMAFWGAPLPRPDHAKAAVLCAIKMRAKCDEMRGKWKAEYGHVVHARAGINSGTAVVGNMGSKHKFNYTVMGDMVNLASRLEGANKPYGTYLMISEFTYGQVMNVVDTRELDYMTVKGKDKPVKVYEVLAETGKTDADTLRAIKIYEEGLLKYRAQRFSDAIADFEKALVIRPEDGPSKMYIERCRHFLAEPPSKDWDGVWHMKEK